jgi:hypothetical protein
VTIDVWATGTRVARAKPKEAAVSTWLWIVIAIAILVVAVAVASRLISRQRSLRLRRGFGPEYDRTVDRTGDRATAEAELLDRKRRHDELDLRPIAPDARREFTEAWRDTQAEFVDAPTTAIDDADSLIQRVMRERGYPIDDFEQRASLVSVDHPLVVQRYRRAHAIAVANAHGEVTTEDLRQAMQDYGALFVEIIDDDVEVDAGDTTATPR